MPDVIEGQSAAATVDNNGVAADPAVSTSTTPSPAATWFDSLPAGLKAEPSLQTFKGKDINAVAESYVNAQKLVGGAIRVPGKDAKPEDIAKFEQTLRTHNGVPESADKYNITRPDGIEWNETHEKSFRTLAHSLGLNDKQVNALVKYDAERMLASQPNPQAAMDAAYDKLVNGDGDVAGWGAAAPKHLATAKRTVEVMGGPGMMEALTKSGMANDPAFVRMMARIGNELKEDGLIVPEESVNSDQDVQSEIDKIEGDLKGPLYDKSHALHQKTVDRKNQLYQILYNK